jgi:hypothetical protein
VVLIEDSFEFLGQRPASRPLSCGCQRDLRMPGNHRLLTIDKLSMLSPTLFTLP